jgi:hypothetical protein
MIARACYRVRFGILILLISLCFTPTLFAIIFLAVVVPSPSSDGQTGTTLKALPQPLVVHVFRYDANGSPTIPASAGQVSKRVGF